MEARERGRIEATVLLSVAVSLIATSVIFLYDKIIDFAHKHDVLPLGIFCFLPLCLVFYFTIRFLDVLWHSRNLGFRLAIRTVPLYCYHRIRNTFPIVWPSLLLAVSLFISVQAGWKYPELVISKMEKASKIGFSLFAIFLILVVVFVAVRLFRKWVISRSHDICQALDRRSGIIRDNSDADKDERIARILYSLTDNSFIFIWGMNLSGLIGKRRKTAVTDILSLIEKNQRAQVLVLLQCPFCSYTRERSLELRSSYESEYVQQCVESISNFWFLQSMQVQVVLRQFEPGIRAIVWGRLKEGSCVGPLDLADAFLWSGDKYMSPEERFMSFVEQGGFVVQEYMNGRQGCNAPLYVGTAAAHGGIWNRLRIKCVLESENCVNIEKPVASINSHAQRQLARDLGMSMKAARSGPLQEVSKFIRENETYQSFRRDVIARAQEKAKELRRIYRTPAKPANAVAVSWNLPIPPPTSFNNLLKNF